MKQIAMLMILLVVALPAPAHDDQARQFYELERRVERLEQRVDQLERLVRRIDRLEMDSGHAAPRQDEEPPPAEHKELFECQAKAIDSIEMKACAKHITD